MPGWLKRNDAQRRATLAPRSEIEALLPASARNTEGHRFTPLGTDMPDQDGSEHDPDLDFFASLAKEVDAVEAPATAPAVARHAPVHQPLLPSAPSDALEIFRAMKSDDSERQTFDFKLKETDMADLLEDLSTTALALRQRKAA
jgi:hypothetical protein